MNRIFDELERKLTALLYGKSFLMAFYGPCPATLTGRPFAFVSTTQQQIYSWRAAGTVFTGGGADVITNDPNTGFPLPEPIISPIGFPGVVRPYNHAQFTAVTPVVNAIDEVNHVMQIAGISTAAYQGLPFVTGIGFFEHSLSVHKKVGTGLGGLTGQAGVTYFLRERQTLALCNPEKFYDWAVAEILLEGVTSVTLPGDKYCFFRVHNLNPLPATVSFSHPGQAFTLNLAPFECRTVRRDRTVTNGNATFANYRSGGHYFWKFEDGDPRFFWGFGNSNRNSMRSSWTGNNIVNPAIAWDWLGHLSNNTLNAWWKRDIHTHADARRTDADGQPLWGDPSNSSTKLGDLIHHQGKIRIARIHRTQKQPAPNQALPVLEWDEVEFRGYNTIVADFAAKGLIVREKADGNLEVTANDANWMIDLIPVGTNLFKPWVPGDATVTTGTGVDTLPTVCLDIQQNPRPIEAAIFEAQTIPLGDFSATAPERIFPRDVTSVPNIRRWFRRLGEAPDVGGYPNAETITETGDPILTLTYPTGRTIQNPGKVMAGIHRVTVADILKLDWWGDKSKASQDSQYVQHTDKTLRLTPEGLVLTYFEKVVATPLPATPGGLFQPIRVTDYVGPDGSKYELTGNPADGFFSVKRIIRFRGHGFGYGTTGQETTTGFFLSNGGAAFSAFFPAGHTRANVRGVIGPVINKDGKDFELQTLDAVETEVKAMRRVRTSALRDNGQLWMLDNRINDLDGLTRFELNRLAEGGNWYVGPPSPPAAFPFGRRTSFQSSPQFVQGTGSILALPLHADHFNAMAAAVNAVQQGSPLTYRALAWWVPSKSKFVAFVTGGWVFNFTSLPVPVNGFAKFATDSDQEALCQLLGVPIKGESDLPGFSDARTTYNVRQVIEGSTTCEGQYPDPITVKIEFEEKETFDEAQGFAYLTRANFSIDPPTFASHNTSPAGPPSGGTVPLAGYDGIRWTTIQDVKAAVEAAGFKFVYVDAFEPVTLEVLNKPTGFEEVEGSIKEESFSDFPPKQLDGSPGTPRPKVSFSRMTKMIVFRRSESSGEVDWKLPMPGNQIYYTTVRGDLVPEFANLQGLWSIKFVQTPPAQHKDGAYIFLNRSFIYKSEGGSDGIHGQWARGGHLAIQWSGGADYERWARWALDEERLLAIQVINSSGVSSANEVFLSPMSSWKGEQDWWEDPFDDYFFGFANTFMPNPGGSVTPQSFVAAPANGRRVTCGPGITLVRAGENERFACLFDIRNNLVSLA